jgi:hypothetical protein
MAAKKKPASKLAEAAGQIDSAAGKSARLADKTSSGERRDSKKQSSWAGPERHFRPAALLNKFST